MPMTYLDSREDLDWLHEVHGVDTADVVCAILYGNEDAPDLVETFTENDYRARAAQWLARGNGGALVRLASGAICAVCGGTLTFGRLDTGCRDIAHNGWTMAETANE